MGRRCEIVRSDARNDLMAFRAAGISGTEKEQQWQQESNNRTHLIPVAGSPRCRLVPRKFQNRQAGTACWWQKGLTALLLVRLSRLTRAGAGLAIDRAGLSGLSLGRRSLNDRTGMDQRLRARS